MMAKNKEIEREVDFKISFKTAQQIAAFLTGEITPEEEMELEIWRNASEENRSLFEKMISKEYGKKKQKDFQTFHSSIGWEEFRMKRNRSKQIQMVRIIARYAAVFTLLLGGAHYLLSPKIEEVVQLVDNSFQPGGTRAHLVLANGEIVDLEKYHGQIGMNGETKVQNQEKQLIYEEWVEEVNSCKEEEYNEIHVPRSGEYQLKLSDGTVVFLNSMTTLRYPVRFTGKTREIELQGEAYFKVAKNVEKPFIVKSSGQSITVLGTQFNVSAFEDEKCIKTTLVEGSVRIDGKGGMVVLKPNEQLVYNKSTHTMQLEQVDATLYTAWTDGFFRFRDVRLEEIMQTIKRWYDVEVIFEDIETKEYVFGLNFNRNEVIDPVLRIFEVNGKVKITTKGKKLIIKKGR